MARSPALSAASRPRPARSAPLPTTGPTLSEADATDHGPPQTSIVLNRITVTGRGGFPADRQQESQDGPKFLHGAGMTSRTTVPAAPRPDRQRSPDRPRPRSGPRRPEHAAHETAR